MWGKPYPVLYHKIFPAEREKRKIFLFFRKNFRHRPTGIPPASRIFPRNAAGMPFPVLLRRRTPTVFGGGRVYNKEQTGKARNRGAGTRDRIRQTAFTPETFCQDSPDGARFRGVLAKSPRAVHGWGRFTKIPPDGMRFSQNSAAPAKKRVTPRQSTGVLFLSQTAGSPGGK